VKALQGFKYYINTYFLPSVGRAASAMLVTMTNGKRKKISITDKFEIDVDGRKVEALSGSTKAIVNIALRFALQFVLTKNTFSVFMADEVDGSFDDNRAKYLNECMIGMTEHLDQVIVISHKPITAQHNIKL
jgi:DNA repair exonuclease SbcCD ATPase subunit